jgi:dTDP-4-dehydrorhamnose reductase
VGRSSRQTSLEHALADPVRAGRVRGRILITGAGGQLGAALTEAFPGADARARQVFDVTTGTLDYRPDLVLHAAAWTDVDGAEEQCELAAAVNVEGTRTVAALGAPVVYFSTDYVFDGRKRAPYLESDEPNPLSVYGRTKLMGEREVRDGWIVRTSWLYGWTGRNFVRTMLQLSEQQDELRVVADQVGCPTYVGDLATAITRLVDLPKGVWHLAADGECSWAEFARAIFEDAGRDCRVVEIPSDELARRAQRPAYSVLRSERERAPRLPHWREGLRTCLARLGELG